MELHRMIAHELPDELLSEVDGSTFMNPVWLSKSSLDDDDCSRQVHDYYGSFTLHIRI